MTTIMRYFKITQNQCHVFICHNESRDLGKIISLSKLNYQQEINDTIQGTSKLLSCEMKKSHT